MAAGAPNSRAGAAAADRARRDCGGVESRTSPHEHGPDRRRRRRRHPTFVAAFGCAGLGGGRRGNLHSAELRSRSVRAGPCFPYPGEDPRSGANAFPRRRPADLHERRASRRRGPKLRCSLPIGSRMRVRSRRKNSGRRPSGLMTVSEPPALSPNGATSAAGSARPPRSAPCRGRCNRRRSCRQSDQRGRAAARTAACAQGHSALAQHQ